MQSTKTKNLIRKLLEKEIPKLERDHPDVHPYHICFAFCYAGAHVGFGTCFDGPNPVLACIWRAIESARIQALSAPDEAGFLILTEERENAESF